MSKQVCKEYWRMLEIPDSSRVLMYGPFETFSECTDISFDFCVEGGIVVSQGCGPSFCIIEKYREL